MANRKITMSSYGQESIFHILSKLITLHFLERVVHSEFFSPEVITTLSFCVYELLIYGPKYRQWWYFIPISNAAHLI